MEVSYSHYRLKFKTPSGTSRGVLTEKDSWFLVARQGEQILAVGECSLIDGLSPDPKSDYQEKLRWACENINASPELREEVLRDYPSIRFGLEQLQCTLKSENPWLLFPSKFTEEQDSITINGLIWMGDYEYMLRQISKKIDDGFHCIKLKIGVMDFEKEIDMIAYIRASFPREKVEIRVDANGAFELDCLDKLERLASFDVHSIEQPIKKGQWQHMARLCKQTPIPIALDEELIGVSGNRIEEFFLEMSPQYIVLKPSLLGGFQVTQQWIDAAECMGIGWWVTSALESNVGLNAISQWTYNHQNTMPQGLGTGGLYTNNMTSPLYLNGEQLFYTRGYKSTKSLGCFQ